MEFRLIIDKDREEEVIVYAHKNTDKIEKIKAIVCEKAELLKGYLENDIVLLTFDEIYCFAIERGRLYALTKDKRLLLKERLYQIEERIDGDFIKINQSCVVKIDKIERFSASFGGALKVKLKNGYTDYVSRRQIKAIKERMGI